MVTYPIAIPAAPNFAAFTLRRVEVAGFTRSPYSGAQFNVAYDGQWFEADCTLPTMRRRQAGLWRGFFSQLRGTFGTFLLGDPTGQVAQGSAASAPGTPLVKGAGQTGNALLIDGAPALATGYLLAGDYIQIGTGLSARLYQLDADANTDSNGEATLSLWPRLRTSPGDNAAVIVAGCKGLFKLSAPVTQDTAQPGPFFDFDSFTAIEAL